MAASQSLFSYLLSAELPEFRKNDGKIGDIKGKVEKTGKKFVDFRKLLDDFQRPCYNFKLRGLYSAEFSMRFRRMPPC